MVRVIDKSNNWKNTQYTLFWIGNNTGYWAVGIIVEFKWVENILEVKRATERLMRMKLQADKRTVVALSFYAPQQGLDNDEKSLSMKVLYNCLEAEMKRIWSLLVVTLMDMFEKK